MSQTADDQYSISVVQDGEVRHLRVLNADRGFVIKFVIWASPYGFEVYINLKLLYHSIFVLIFLRQQAGRSMPIHPCSDYREAGREDQEQAARRGDEGNRVVEERAFNEEGSSGTEDRCSEGGLASTLQFTGCGQTGK